MKKLVLVFSLIAILSPLTFSQGGYGPDPGIPDSIIVECDSLIVGRSMPVKLRVVNDYPLREIAVAFQVDYLGSGQMQFDSLRYLGQLLDPSILRIRFTEFIDSVDIMKFVVLRFTENDMNPGNDYVLEYFFTPTEPGNVFVDSTTLPPSYELVYIASLPVGYVIYTPVVVPAQFSVVEGDLLPEISIEDHNLIVTAGEPLESNVNFITFDGSAGTVQIKSVSDYDDPTLQITGPALSSNNGYNLSWTPSGGDIGIWRIVVEGCDGSGQCVQDEITVQVVESAEYISDFTFHLDQDFHTPTNLIIEDVDNDLYPEIVTCGSKYALHSSFATYGISLPEFSVESKFVDNNVNYARFNLQIGYLDSDNYLDIINPAIGVSTAGITVSKGYPDASFEVYNPYKSTAELINSPTGLLKDLNRDNYVDYCAARLNKVLLYHGQGNGYFTYAGTIELGENVKSINSEDFNTNGKNDLAIGTEAGVYIYANLGNGTFQYLTFYPQMYGAADINITNRGADFNGDRYYDLVISTPSVGGVYSEIVLYKGNPNGTFDRTTLRTTIGQVFGNSIGDFNDDGFLDIAYVNGTFNYIGFLYGDGTGQFLNEQRVFVEGEAFLTVQSADIDLDGDLDIISTGGRSNEKGDLLIMENKLDPQGIQQNSFDISVINNARFEMTSSSGKKINNVSNTFSSGALYHRNIDSDIDIDKIYKFHTIDEGEYRVKVDPKFDLPAEESFGLEFVLNGEEYRLAKDAPMNASGYLFSLYPSGNSPVLPEPGRFITDTLPQFIWEVDGEVDFQLSKDISFTNLVIDTVIIGNNFMLQNAIFSEDTTSYYWRVKQHSQPQFDKIYAFNLVNRVPTDVDDNEPELPGSFMVSQNYPNPFNPSTEFHFTVPSKTFVQMDIYSVTGQKVRSLVSEEFTAGDHVVQWNGNDDSGKQTASGVYFMKFRAGDFSKSIKMVLMK